MRVMCCARQECSTARVWRDMPAAPRRGSPCRWELRPPCAAPAPPQPARASKAAPSGPARTCPALTDTRVSPARRGQPVSSCSTCGRQRSAQCWIGRETHNAVRGVTQGMFLAYHMHRAALRPHTAQPGACASCAGSRPSKCAPGTSQPAAGPRSVHSPGAARSPPAQPCPQKRCAGGERGEALATAGRAHTGQQAGRTKPSKWPDLVGRGALGCSACLKRSVWGAPAHGGTCCMPRAQLPYPDEARPSGLPCAHLHSRRVRFIASARLARLGRDGGEEGAAGMVCRLR